MKASHRLFKQISIIATVVTVGWLSAQAVLASPPVRIAVVPGGGSGEEQTAVDNISSALQDDQNIVLSTVNPDWYVVCNVIEQTDQAAGTVKVNGTVTIKTTDGRIINTIAVQTNKSDYSLSPGTPLNKALVQSAVVEALQGMVQRAIDPIENAATIEIATRDRVISAQGLADKDQYDEAINLLAPITPDTTHFQAVRALMGAYQMEKQALDLVKQAENSANKHQYSQAIQELSNVNTHSKRYKLAKVRMATYRAALARLGKNKAL